MDKDPKKWLEAADCLGASDGRLLLEMGIYEAVQTAKYALQRLAWIDGQPRGPLEEQVAVNAELVARNRLLVDGIRAYRVREAKRTAARCPCTLIDLDEADAWEAEHGDLAGRAGHPGDSAATLRGHAAQEEDRDPSRPHRDD